MSPSHIIIYVLILAVFALPFVAAVFLIRWVYRKAVKAKPNEHS